MSNSATNERVSQLAAALEPPPRQTVSEWADANRRLSSEASAERGECRTDRAPYQRAIMDALSPHSPHERLKKRRVARPGPDCGAVSLRALLRADSWLPQDMDAVARRVASGEPEIARRRLLDLTVVFALERLGRDSG